MGISLSLTGVIQGLSIVTESIFRPFFGILCDKTGRRDLILTLSLIFYAVPITALSLVYLNTSNSNISEIATGNSSLQFDAANPTSTGYNLSLSFWIVLVLSCIGAVFRGPSFSLADATVYDILGKAHSHLWGKQRLYGTVSWAVYALLLGYFLDVVDNYLIILITFCASTIFGAVVVFFFLPKESKHDLPMEKDIPFSQVFAKAISNKLFCLTCFISLVSGFLLGVETFLNSALLTDLNAPKRLFGLVTLVACLPEIPCLFYAGNVIKFLGETNIFILMFLAFAARFFVCCFITESNIWWILPVQVLHVFCYGTFFAASTRLVTLITPKGTTSSVLSILGTCYLTIGMGGGMFLAPIPYEKMDQFNCFLMFTLICLFFTIFIIFLHFIYLKNTLKAVHKEVEALPKIEEEVEDDPMI